LLINPKIRGRRREMLLAAAAGEHPEPTQAIFIRVIEYTVHWSKGNRRLPS
jgi:hypothetical protein